MKNFINKAIDTAMNADEYFEAHPEIIDKIKTTKESELIPGSVKDEFRENK